MTDISIQLKVVQIENPEAFNFILGQTHFIKTVEDIHEALVNAVPGDQVRAGVLRVVGRGPGALDRHR